MIELDTASLLALAAALSWTLAGIFGHKPAVALGSVHFNRIRMIVSMTMLAIWCLITGTSFGINKTDFYLILISGIIGAAAGDYFLFLTMRRMGPRRTGVLFAMNAPFAASLGWLFLGESLSAATIFAIVLGFAGIVLAVIYGKRRDLVHVWENITPPLWLGIIFGLLAALGQAIGILVMRPVMEGGLDPAIAGFYRTAIAVVVFHLVYPIQLWSGSAPKQYLPDRSLAVYIIANGFFGMAFGMALLMKALETGSVATVSILSSTAPLMMLPIVWFQTRLIPPLAAWIGALLVVLCSILLV